MTGIFSRSVQYSLPLLLFTPPREYSLEIIKLPFIPKVCMTGILSPTSGACGACVSIWADSTTTADKHHVQTTIPLIYFSHDSHPSCVCLPKKGESGPLMQREAATWHHRFPGFPWLSQGWFPLALPVCSRKRTQGTFLPASRIPQTKPGFWAVTRAASTSLTSANSFLPSAYSRWLSKILGKKSKP